MNRIFSDLALILLLTLTGYKKGDNSHSNSSVVSSSS